MGEKKEISVRGVYDTNKNMNDAEPKAEEEMHIKMMKGASRNG